MIPHKIDMNLLKHETLLLSMTTSLRVELYILSLLTRASLCIEKLELFTNFYHHTSFPKIIFLCNHFHIQGSIVKLQNII